MTTPNQMFNIPFNYKEIIILKHALERCEFDVAEKNQASDVYRRISNTFDVLSSTIAQNDDAKMSHPSK
jgi:hypothetical protein